MFPKMVACNATNSAAIDHEGNIWVWGSGKYGLLGDHIKDVNYMVPKPLYLTTSGMTDEEVNARDAFTREDQLAKYKVKDISIGQYHMIVVAVDSEMHDQFTQLDYFSDIFAKLRNYLVHTKFPKLGVINLSKDKQSMMDDRSKVEITLKHIFSQDKYRWPLAKWITLYNLFFKELNLHFSENVITTVDKLQTDLAVSADKQFINLKELRDQILGERDNTNVVFGWGLQDERLCSRSNPADRAPRYMRCKVLGSLTDKKVTRVATGNSYSLALTQNGDVYAWGIGKSGSLGLGEIMTMVQNPTKLVFRVRNDDTLNITDPEQASQVKSEQIIAIESGQTHCMALTVDNEIYSWGNGQGGRLGHGDSIGQNIPEKIKLLKGVKVVDIACGDQHSGCITDQGQVYVWGVGLNGRLGIGMDINHERPTIISEFNMDPCYRLFFGMNTSFAISKSSELYVWGSGQQGKIGMPNTLEQQLLLPRRLFTLSSKRIAEFAPGPFHSLALTYDGFIYAFGNSKEGKLGLNLQDQRMMQMTSDMTSQQSNFIEIPTVLTNAPMFSIQGELQKIFKSYAKFQEFTSEGVVVDGEGAKTLRVIQTACSDKNSYFLLNSGVIYATGANDRWQCSRIDEALKELDLIEEEYLRPQNLSEKEIAERGGVVIPEEAAAIIQQFQTMQQINMPYPVQIVKKNVNSLLPIKHISAGSDHVLAVSNTGQCYGWGDNEYAQLGIGILPSSIEQDNFVAKPTFLKLLSDKKILMTAAGKHHSLFLTELGHVYSAGLNEYGQLGVKSHPMEITKRAEYNVSILQNYLYQKTKSTPQRVDIENVRFIAAGDSHSLAITDSSHEGNFESKLYSWGWSAYGQLGHTKIKNQYNLDRPKVVKFLGSYDTKVAFVSGGSKHTVCIDTEGKLWFFGDRSSVGIRASSSKKMQFYPVQLVPENREETGGFDAGLIFVDAKDEENIAIDSEHQVYVFGSAVSQRRTVKPDYESDNDMMLNDSGIDPQSNNRQMTYFKKVLQKNRRPLLADCVSRGKDHNIALFHQNSIPFGWGDNSSGQLGLGQGDRLFFPMPNSITKLASLIDSKEATTMQFQQIIRQAKTTSQGAASSQKSAAAPSMQAQQLLQSNYRFPIQVELKKQSIGIPSTQTLLKADIKLMTQFNKLVEDFSQVCKGVAQGQSTMTTRAQDGLITRILNFPTPIQGHTLIQSTIPKSISKNRQVFEAIFLQLQAHPCYLINWIQGSRFFDQPKDIVVLLFAIFGKREMKDNNRVLNTIMIIAKKMFDAEARINNFKELCSVFRTDSPFRTIFKLIFGMQSTNLGFTKQIISKLLYKLQVVYSRIVEDEQTEYDSRVENMMIQEIFLFVLDTIKKKIEVIGGDDIEKAQSLKGSSLLSIQVLSLLDYAYQKLVKIAKQGLRTGSSKKEQKKRQKAETEGEDKQGESSGEEEEDTGDRDMSMIERDQIFPYLLDLLFEDLLDTIESLSYEDIRFQFWDYEMTHGAEPIYDLYGPVEGDSYLKKLAKYIKMYFRQQNTNMPADFTELITTGQISFKADRHLAIRSLTQVNFREKMAQSLFTQNNYKPFDLEFVLVQQLFSSSVEITNASMAASVQDIIYVYNSILQDMELICQSEFNNDPLRVLVRQLGDQPITQAVKEENLRMRINLQINCRFLYTNTQIVKCRYCFSPVTESMIPRDRFVSSLRGSSWRCQNRNCSKQNNAGVFQCSNCSRPIPAINLGKDLIFKRYEQKSLEPDAKLFKFVLKTLAVVEDNQDIYSLIEQELQKQPSEKNRFNFQRHEKLNRFRDMIEEYSNRESRNTYAVMQLMGVKVEQGSKGAHKLQLLLAEKEFLDSLSQVLIEQAEIKKSHQKLIKDYQTALSKINLLTPLLKQRTVQVCQHLDQILYGSYIGICSPFLKEQIESLGGNFKKKEVAAANANDPSASHKTTKERIWAGSLHIEMKDLGKKQKKKSENEEVFNSNKANNSKKNRNDIITEYFNEITTKKALELNYDGNSSQDHSPKKARSSTAAGAAAGKGTSEPLEDEAKKKMEAEQAEIGNSVIMQAVGQGVFGKARAISGQIKFVFMMQEQAIKKANSERYDLDILKNSHFSFNDDGKGGFQVELVYKEPRSMQAKFVKMDQVVLENFDISREVLLEMRRNFAYHSVIIFGMLQFRNYYLVRQLNNIVAMNNIFSSLNFDENGYRAEKKEIAPHKFEGIKNNYLQAGLQMMDDEPSDDEHTKDAKSGQQKKGKGGTAAGDERKSNKKKDQRKKK